MRPPGKLGRAGEVEGVQLGVDDIGEGLGVAVGQARDLVEGVDAAGLDEVEGRGQLLLADRGGGGRDAHRGRTSSLHPR